MKIVWSPLAVRRVRDAAQYIARDKAEAAQRWAASVFEAVERLGDLPESGRIVPELGRPDLRELLHGDYRIIYRVTAKAVLILTVRHGKRLFDQGEVER